MKVGGWKLVENDACKLPQKLATGFTQVYGNRDGAGFKPLLYIAQQLVSGVNHMLICEQTLITHPIQKSIVKVVLYENLKGTFMETEHDVIIAE